VVLLFLVIVIGLNLARGSGSKGDGTPKLPEALRASLEQDGCKVDDKADQGQRHVSSVTYSVNPPAGGDHDPIPAPAAFYDLANAPGDGHLVHSLEHGFVIVWYRPDGVAPATVEGLRDLASRHRWVLAVPRPSLPTALAATAWHRRLLCPEGATGPIGNFVTAFRNQGPEKGFV
jgi:hypothetical protein